MVVLTDRLLLNLFPAISILPVFKISLSMMGLKQLNVFGPVLLSNWSPNPYLPCRNTENLAKMGESGVENEKPPFK